MTPLHDRIEHSMSSMAMSDDEFRLLRDLIEKHFGISLNESKRSLLIGRLQKYLKEAGHASFQAFHQHLVKTPGSPAWTELINRVSTNHTFFYREKPHFEHFSAHALPEIFAHLKKARDHDLRVWCAACSTGEEAYTLSMLILVGLGLDHPNWNAGLLATDISVEVLEVAKAGLYSADRVKELPAALLKKYMVERPDGRYEAVARLKKEILFRRFNLMNPVYPFKKPFHAVFCRNVMIYFDLDTRNALVRRIHECLAPGGYLYIGHAETLDRQVELFQYVKPGVYRRARSE